MFSFKRCYAPISGNKRCPKATVNTQMVHCSEHATQAASLRKRYKKVCGQADKLDLDSVKKLASSIEKVSFLLKCYSCYQEAYDLRLAYKNKHIVPECSDKGHEAQFTIIRARIEACEEKLSTIYSELAKAKRAPPTTKEPAAEATAPPEEALVEEAVDLSFIKEVSSFKARRAADEQKTSQLIAQYIKENREFFLERRRVAKDICEYLERFLTSNNKFRHHHLAAMTIIVAEMNLFGHSIEQGSYPYTRWKEYKLDSEITQTGPLNYFLNNCQQDYLICLIRGINEHSSLVKMALEALRQTWEQAEFSPTKASLFFCLPKEQGLLLSIRSP